MEGAKAFTLTADDWQALCGPAYDALLRGDSLRCSHFGTDRPPLAIVCAMHPAAGLHCPACYREHCGRHDELEERRCDRCQRVVDAIHPVMFDAEGALPTTDTRSVRALVIGTIRVGSVGLCGLCHLSVQQAAKAVAS